MANDGTVKIGTELDDSGFKSGLLGGDIESVDVNDIISARFDIVEVYEKPARKKRAAAMAEEAREILYRPEIKRLLALYGLNGKR